jgi:hypothetical protein
VDKVVLKFLADVLYLKGIIYYSEFNAIMDAKTAEDLDNIVEMMLTDSFSPYLRGECYL